MSCHVTVGWIHSHAQCFLLSSSDFFYSDSLALWKPALAFRLHFLRRIDSSTREQIRFGNLDCFARYDCQFALSCQKIRPFYFWYTRSWRLLNSATRSISSVEWTSNGPARVSGGFCAIRCIFPSVSEIAPSVRPIQDLSPRALQQDMVHLSHGPVAWKPRWQEGP